MLEAEEVNFEEVCRGGHESHLLRAQAASQLLLQMEPREGVGNGSHLLGHSIVSSGSHTKIDVRPSEKKSQQVVV